MMNYKKVFLLLVFMILAALIINEYRLNSFKQNVTKQKIATINASSIKLGKSFFNNYNWMPNNNVLQYSSYLFESSNGIIIIKSLITVNRDNIKEEEFLKSDFFCSIMSIKTGRYIDVAATNVMNLIHRKTKVVECYFDNKGFLETSDISVAIIRINDFTHLKMSYLNNLKYRVLPYFMINYQVPTIKEVNIEKVKNIAICVQFTYNLTTMIKDWVKIHEELNVPRIVLYDSTINDSLINFIRNNNLNKIVQVRPYYFDEHKTCSLDTLNWFTNNEYSNFDAKVYEDICYSFVYKAKFNYSQFETRLIHEDLSANDCYISESQFFEFVGLYDFDEVIFPRRFEKDYFHDIDSCQDNSKVCAKDPFAISLYDYVVKLLATQYKNNITRLASIYFDAGLYLQLDYNINRLMMDFNSISGSLESHKINETIKLSLDNNTDHKLLISSNDFAYVKDLASKLDAFKCLFEIFQSKKKHDLNLIFSRFLYLILETKENIQRPYKCLHYTKNVKTIYTHGSVITLEDTLEFLPSIDLGHFLSHFRSNTIEHIQRNIDSSIRKFKIDFEYMTYLVHNLTNYCLNI